ncbi:hypothetical protein KUTeg_002565 [Tegillarca granosa]|uniref:Uncharacterized protein n=1 Tax=Tegillarca granosa TaxID=220873 RepID=A0ABQ9FUP5_TEGGR|nr:hypothetical protein KUTeg_002565 [Tegillarca granosa]
MDSDGNESGHDGDSAMEDEGEGHYDNISKYKGKTSYVSGQGSLDRKDLKRSHSHSSSSNVDSPKGSLLRRTRSNEMKDPKRQGVFRHVTWGPDVMDGDVFENVEAKTVNGQKMTRSHGDNKPKEQSYYVMGSAKHRTSESQSVNPSKPSYIGSGPYYITSQPYVTSQPYHSTSQPYHATSQPYQAKGEPNHVTSQSYHLSSQPYQVKSEPNHITSQPYQATSQPYQAQSKPIYISSQPYQVTSQLYQAQSESSHNTSKPYKVTSISQPFESNEALVSRQMDLNKTSDRISQPFLSVNDTFNITINEASMGSSETTTLSNQSTFGDYDELISEPSHFKYFPNTKKSTGYKKPDSGSTVPKSTITSQPNYNHQQKSDMCLLSNKPHDFPGDFPPPTSKSDSVFDYDDVSSEYKHRTVTTLFQPVYSAPYPVTKEYSRITSESFRMMDPIKSQSSYNASYSVAEEYHHVSSIPDQVTTKPQPLYSVPYSRTRGYNTATSQSLPVTSDYLDRKNVFKSYVPNSFVPVVSHKESVTTEVNHTTNDTYPLSTTNLSVTEPQLIASLSDNVTKLKPENGPNYQTERSHLGRK